MSKLADLITQAPPDDYEPAPVPLPAKHTGPSNGNGHERQQPGKVAPAQQQQLTSEPSAAACCRCRFWSRSAPSAPKMNAVVPCDDPPSPESKPLAPVSTEASSEAPAQEVKAHLPPQEKRQDDAAAEAKDPEVDADSDHQRPASEEPMTLDTEFFECPGQLGPQTGSDIGKKTLVLDLDETLVHSSFRVIPTADIIITVELEGERHRVFVRKRPGVDEFLLQMAKLYEVVVYTASMAKYANPLLDDLDKQGLVSWRLFREACTRQTHGYVKDLSKLGRNLKNVIIIDNSPMCYSWQRENAIPIKTWRDDMSDHDLYDLIPILSSLAEVHDIPLILRQIVWTPDQEDEVGPVTSG
mmetsp:Transcript_114767/g.244932  ORF Transcript_114767/g.244932 Transcript_114767/m.244932 type:complete len:355 (-) Transcript_114767:112-1176(-)